MGPFLPKWQCPISRYRKVAFALAYPERLPLDYLQNHSHCLAARI